LLGIALFVAALGATLFVTGLASLLVRPSALTVVAAVIAAFHALSLRVSGRRDHYGAPENYERGESQHSVSHDSTPLSCGSDNGIDGSMHEIEPLTKTRAFATHACDRALFANSDSLLSCR
jgi:hypothetical protein